MIVWPRIDSFFLIHLYSGTIRCQHLEVHDDEHRQGQNEGKINDDTDENDRGAANKQEGIKCMTEKCSI